jgi:hypothetical protein
MSTSKLADANYVTVFTKEEVQVFDAEAASCHERMALPDNKTVESTPHAKPLKHQHRHRANEQTGN